MDFLTGYGRVCITPQESVPLAGYGNTSRRMSQTVDSDLYCTCIAFTGTNGQTALLMTCDLCVIWSVWCDEARQAIAEATGVPAENIIICATHTHEAPDHANTDHESILRHRQAMIGWTNEAAQLALADRAPAQMLGGTTHIETVSYVRHYVLANGTYAGDNFGDFNSAPIVDSTTEADRTMQLLKFVRPGKQDIILANWQTHPHRSGGATRYEINADIVGGMRNAMERDTGCHFAYFSGASGNINTRSRRMELNLVGDHVVCGEFMAKHAIAALPTLEPMALGAVHCASQIRPTATDHAMDHLAEIGQQLRNEWERTGDTAACIEKGKPYGIHSPYHAGAIWNKSKAPQTRDVSMTVFTIGDAAFVGAPYEMFDTNGMQIKQGAPYGRTFICQLANAYVGYIPSAYAYTHGCYEADCTPFANGSGETLAMEYIRILCDIKETL